MFDDNVCLWQNGGILRWRLTIFLWIISVFVGLGFSSSSSILDYWILCSGVNEITSHRWLKAWSFKFWGVVSISFSKSDFELHLKHTTDINIIKDTIFLNIWNQTNCFITESLHYYNGVNKMNWILPHTSHIILKTKKKYHHHFMHQDSLGKQSCKEPHRSKTILLLVCK